MEPDKDMLLPTFSAELLNQRIREILLSSHTCPHEMMSHITSHGGKMIRPRLVHLSASFGETDADKVLDLAVAVELIHLASLVHDDVIDRASTRRGQDSINSLWGNQAAVLLGDYLFAQAFQLINTYTLPAVMATATEAIKTMCMGEISQMNMAYQLQLKPEDYLHKIHGKTACLFAAACKIGAITASLSPAQVKMLEEYGLCLGYAYQILDDLLDYLADPLLLNKAVGSDWQEGNVTLPLIALMKDKKYQEWLQNLFPTRRLLPLQWQQLITALYDSGAVKYCLNAVEDYLQTAHRQLDRLPAVPAVQQLQSLADYFLNGYYNKLCKTERQFAKDMVYYADKPGLQA